MRELPQNVAMLLSFVNTQLRDSASDLDDFCKSYRVDMSELKDKLASINYSYDAKVNQFV